MKSKGQSLVPCGTELGTSNFLDLVLFSLTQKDLLFQISLIHPNVLPTIPYECNLTIVVYYD